MHNDSFRPLVKLALKQKCEEVMTLSKILTPSLYDMESWSRNFGEEREDVILVTFPLDLSSETRS